MRKDKYYVVNANCGEWYSNLNKAISEIKKGYFGEELTIIYDITQLDDPMNVSELSFDDELMEFENCKLIKDWRKK